MVELSGVGWNKMNWGGVGWVGEEWNTVWHEVRCSDMKETYGK